MTEIETIKAEIAKLQEKVERLEAEAARDDEWPKYGDLYYYISHDGQVYNKKCWNDKEFDSGNISIGNVFRTREDAEFSIERLKVLDEMRRFAFEPDWKDSAQKKWYINHNYTNGNIELSLSYYESFGIPAFETQERARDCVADIGKDRLQRYYFGVKE